MSGNFNGSEKRKHARYNWNAPVTLTGKEFSVEGEIQNISMGGILATSEYPLSYGEEVLVEFAVPKLDKKISAKCTVRWISGEHTGGFNFVGLKAIETWAISQLIRQLADDQLGAGVR